MFFTVLGDPVGKGRPRVVTLGGYNRAYTPKNTASWEQVCAMMAKAEHEGPPRDTPQRLTVRAIKSRPKRLQRKKDAAGLVWRTTKPDGDNVLKIVADALVMAGVLKDDTFVVVWECYCMYSEKGEPGRIEVSLTPEDAL